MSKHASARRALTGTIAAGLLTTPLALGLTAPAQAAEPQVAISAIQGTGAASPLVGQQVTTQGVVTALYEGTLNGFYLQTAGTGGATDATPGASDAVFVFGGSDFDGWNLALGDSVEVTGAVSEFSGSTQITTTKAQTTKLATALAPVTALAIAYPTTEAGREAHEGELLAPTDDFTVTNSFATNTFGEIGLATGDRPLLQPTEVASPGTPAYADVVADNAARGVVLDDGASISFLNGAGRDVPLPG